MATLALSCTGCDRRGQEPAQPQAAASAAATGRGALERGALERGAIERGALDRGRAGTPLPAITVTDAAGRSLDLASLKGKPVLLNLWATWCAPCVAELPGLDALAARRGTTLRVVAVSQDMQTGRVADFLRERGVARLDPWLDAKADLSFTLGAATLPTSVLYDARGREVWRYAGAMDWAGKEAQRLLADGGAP